jgi:hypothetical protein
MPAEAHPSDHPLPPLQPPFEIHPAMSAPFDDFPHPFSAQSTPMTSYWDSPVASSSSRPHGHSRQSSTSSLPAYVPVNTGRRGSAKDPDALQAAIERTKNSRKKRTNSTASALPADDEEDDDVRAPDSPEESTRSVQFDYRSK